MPTLHGKNIAFRFQDQAKYAAITNYLPRSRVVPDPKDQYPTLLIKHGLEEYKVLTNLGVKNVPHPITNRSVYDYPGHYIPMPHQIETAAFLSKHHRCFVFNEQRTGKTISSLWAADYLMREGLVKKCLIITTISTMKDVWAEHVFQHLSNRHSVVLHGSKSKRLKALDMLDMDFYIINHDGVKVIEQELIARDDIDLIIVDEASYLRSGSSDRYKRFAAMLRPTQRLWLMTGTPCSTGPTDAWALAKLINPAGVPKYFTRFKQQTMTQITNFKWVPKPDAYKVAFDAMQPAIRIKKRDVILNLPPLTFEYREVELTHSQEKAYKQMHNLLVLEAQGEGGGTITAVNAADKLNKLRQVCLGVVRDSEGNYQEIDYGNRYNVLKECIEEAGDKAKVIIFVPFKGILRSLTDKLRADGYTCEFVNGDVSANRRSEIFGAFKTQDNPQILLAHPQVAAHGLELAVSSDIIWYGPQFSFEIFDQANARIASGQQKNAMTITCLYATKMERGIYEVLKSRERGQNSILDLYKREVGII